MTDIIYRYNHSKHNRRLKSRQKKSQKLCIKYENVDKCNKIKFKEKLYVNNHKSLKEIQRKQWKKYNKKSKPRNNNNNKLAAEWDGYDSVITDDSDDDDESKGDSVEYIWCDDELYIKKNWFNDETDSTDYCSAILTTKIKGILRKQFFTYECQYIPFKMSTFYGECCFLYYILEKLGIVAELFHTKYLIMCDKERRSKISYYNGYIDAITANLISAQHLLYILDEIDLMAGNAFRNDYFYHSKSVVMNKNVLINILDNYNCADIGIDLCSLIADYLMNKKDDILFHSEDHDGKELKIETCKYNIGKHKVIDILTEEQDVQTMLRKIYDGKDITDYYTKCSKIWRESTPSFHYGKYKYTFENILKIVWYKFKQYYSHQLLNNFEIKYEVIYTILLYYTEAAVVCRNINCYIQTNRKDVRIWKRCYKATAKQELLQNIFVMISKCISIHVPRKRISINLHDIFANHLCDKVSSMSCDDDSDGADTKDFCELMIRNCYFNHVFSVTDFFENADHHKQHKELWINIWKQIPVNTNKEKLENIYELTLYHCRKYAIFSKTHSECGSVYRRRSGRKVWGQQKMKKFYILQFIANDIIPIILDILNIDKYDKNLILNMLIKSNNNILSYDMFLKSLDRIVRILDNEKCKNSALWIMKSVNINEYVHDKFSRNYVAKQIYSKKKCLRSKFRKYNGKSNDKRIQNKMRKYKPNFLSC